MQHEIMTKSLTSTSRRCTWSESFELIAPDRVESVRDGVLEKPPPIGLEGPVAENGSQLLVSGRVVFSLEVGRSRRNCTHCGV